ALATGNRAGMDARLAQYKKLGLVSSYIPTLTNTANGAVQQAQQIRTDVQKKVDIIISALTSPTAINPAIAEAAKANIPLISESGTATDPHSVNVQANPYLLGAQTATALVNIMHHKGNLLAVDGQERGAEVPRDAPGQDRRRLAGLVDGAGRHQRLPAVGPAGAAGRRHERRPGLAGVLAPPREGRLPGHRQRRSRAADGRGGVGRRATDARRAGHQVHGRADRAADHHDQEPAAVGAGELERERLAHG